MYDHHDQKQITPLMAGSMGHHLNNSLNIMLGFTTQIKSRATSDLDNKELDIVLSQIERASQYIKWAIQLSKETNIMQIKAIEDKDKL